MASKTQDFSSADIKTMFNNAALSAGFQKKDCVTYNDLKKARDEIILTKYGNNSLENRQLYKNKSRYLKAKEALEERRSLL